MHTALVQCAWDHVNEKAGWSQGLVKWAVPQRGILLSYLSTSQR